MQLALRNPVPVFSSDAAQVVADVHPRRHAWTMNRGLLKQPTLPQARFPPLSRVRSSFLPELRRGSARPLSRGSAAGNRACQYTCILHHTARVASVCAWSIDQCEFFFFDCGESAKIRARGVGEEEGNLTLPIPSSPEVLCSPQFSCD